ncbi:hypothetical protein IAT38_004281 [Cryptococcus sp. DSM 104549]
MPLIHPPQDNSTPAVSFQTTTPLQPAPRLTLTLPPAFVRWLAGRNGDDEMSGWEIRVVLFMVVWEEPEDGNLVGQQFGPWTVAKRLGEGGGAVWGVVHETGHLAALKVQPRLPFEKYGRKDRREIDIMQSWYQDPHDRILKLRWWWFTADHIFWLLDFAKGGDLHCRPYRFPEPLSEAGIRRLFTQLIEAVAECHRRGISHKDIKPANVMLDENDCVMLGDFGMASRERMSDGMGGTPGFMAPEAYEPGRDHTGFYDTYAADIFACGVTLFCLFADGEMPFNGETIEEVIKRTLSGHFKMPAKVPEAAWDLMFSMLETDVSCRPSADEILQHPWIITPPSPVLKPQSTLAAVASVPALSLSPPATPLSSTPPSPPSLALPVRVSALGVSTHDTASNAELAALLIAPLASSPVSKCSFEHIVFKGRATLSIPADESDDEREIIVLPRRAELASVTSTLESIEELIVFSAPTSSGNTVDARKSSDERTTLFEGTAPSISSGESECSYECIVVPRRAPPASEHPILLTTPTHTNPSRWRSLFPSSLPPPSAPSLSLIQLPLASAATGHGYLARWGLTLGATLPRGLAHDYLAPVLRTGKDPPAAHRPSPGRRAWISPIRKPGKDPPRDRPRLAARQLRCGIG